jgi:hypothetical protein
MNDANNLMSLAAYAKRRGVSSVAVSKAVSTGRLTESVVRDERGVPKIGDPELADREWEENTRSRVDKPTASPARSPEALNVPDYLVSRARREAAAALREEAQAELVQLELAERKGELVEVAEIRAEVEARYARVRTRVLGVPARAAQRLPHIADEMVPVIEDAIREALEELASRLGLEGNGVGDE